VAEGLITVRPWMESITNTAVTFVDGDAEEFDGIVFGTGFYLHLPFLSEAFARSSTSTRCTWTRTATPFIPICRGWLSWACGISRAGTLCRWSCRRDGSRTRGAARSRRRVRQGSGRPSMRIACGAGFHRKPGAPRSRPA